MNIFLLRGLVREKEHWGVFKQQVQEAFPEANIIVPEIQGVGEFCDTDSPIHFSEMIEFMREQHINEFNSDKKNIILAMSLGGMIAREWIEMHPNDFQKVILINTSFKGITPIFKRLRPTALLSFLKIFFTFTVEGREKKILELVSNNKEERAKRLPQWVDIQKNRAVKRINFIRQITATLISNSIKTKPTNSQLLIIAAKGDRLCHYKSSKLLYKQWGGELQIHPWAGHDIPIDDPKWLISTVKSWVQSKK